MSRELHETTRDSIEHYTHQHSFPNGGKGKLHETTRTTLTKPLVNSHGQLSDYGARLLRKRSDLSDEEARLLRIYTRRRDLHDAGAWVSYRGR